MSDNRFNNEKDFHDEWAQNTSTNNINVKEIIEAKTSPELRYIFKFLENKIRNKKVLDVGSGLGEVSVYFALKGGKVTSTDISPKMLEFSKKLAKHNGVEITTHLSTAEDLKLGENEQFDIIYTGNLLHHVDINITMQKILKHLKTDGYFVSWDPLKYNPAINVYRKKATDVRTIDEHPLSKSDISLITKNLRIEKIKFFWLTTLLIFVIMALIQKRDPNKERYWKKVVEESSKWNPLYSPLEIVDKIILRILPFFKWWCWNVVVIGKKK